MSDGTQIPTGRTIHSIFQQLRRQRNGKGNLIAHSGFYRIQKSIDRRNAALIAVLPRLIYNALRPAVIRKLHIIQNDFLETKICAFLHHSRQILRSIRGIGAEPGVAFRILPCAAADAHQCHRRIRTGLLGIGKAGDPCDGMLTRNFFAYHVRCGLLCVAEQQRAVGRFHGQNRAFSVQKRGKCLLRQRSRIQCPAMQFPHFRFLLVDHQIFFRQRLGRLRRGFVFVTRQTQMNSVGIKHLVFLQNQKSTRTDKN